LLALTTDIGLPNFAKVILFGSFLGDSATVGDRDIPLSKTVHKSVHGQKAAWFLLR